MEETIVSLADESGKCRMTGTTYVRPGVPWPVDVLFDTEEMARYFAGKHGWTITE